MEGNPGPEDSFQSTASKKSAPSVTELQMTSANNLNELENECSLNTEWLNLQSSEVVSLKTLFQKANEN